MSKARLDEIGAGGLSGEILSGRSTEIIEYITKKTEGSVPIMGVGGIHDIPSALEKIRAGAGLIQVYTGFVYGGPSFIKRIARAIRQNP